MGSVRAITMVPKCVVDDRNHHGDARDHGHIQDGKVADGEIDKHDKGRDVKSREHRRQQARRIFEEIDGVKPFDEDFAERWFARGDFTPAKGRLLKQSPPRRGGC